MSTSINEGLALFLGGGGARAAYQAGVLRAFASARPEFEPQLLTGVSAGAINIAHLANRPGSFAEATETLEDLWRRIEVGRVFEVRTLPLLYHAMCVLSKLAIGWAPSLDPIRGMVDTAPLAEFLHESYGSSELLRVQENIDRGAVRAVALLGLEYATGRTISFCSGSEFHEWERPLRRAFRTNLRLEHVMASAALPLFFPAVDVGGTFYGDGGVRLTAPLASAVHLGAERLLAISTRYRPTGKEAEIPRFHGAPSPAQITGNLFAAMFLDVVDQDALQLERINSLIAKVPEGERNGLRNVGLLVIRPSRDLGALANDFEPKLPWMFRFLLRRLGGTNDRSQVLASTVLFQDDYLRLLLEIGEEDGHANLDALDKLMA